jgi:hypothetical protein
MLSLKCSHVVTALCCVINAWQSKSEVLAGKNILLHHLTSIQFNECIGYYFKLFLFLIPTCFLFPYFIHTALYSPYGGIYSLDRTTKCSHQFDTGSKQKTGFRRWTPRTMWWIVSTSHPRPGIVSDSYKTILTYNFILLPETTNPKFAS